MKVNLLQDDLSTFIHNWESVVAGMSHVPDERTLRDILLRQIRRSARIKLDLDLYDRAKEGTSTHSYSFLIQCIRDLLTRERVRRNRDRIAKSQGDKFGAPAPRREGTRPQSGGRGRRLFRDSNASFRSRSSSRGSQGRSTSPTAVCYDFLNGKCTRGANCKFLHKNRSPSPKPPDKQKKINKVCTYWKKGKCTRGDKCKLLHKSDKDRTPSPSRPAGMEAAPEKPRSPSPAPKRRPGRGRSKSPRAIGQRRLPAAFTRRPLAMLGMPFKGGVLRRRFCLLAGQRSRAFQLTDEGGSLLTGQGDTPPATQIKRTARNQIRAMPGTPWRLQGSSNKQ